MSASFATPSFTSLGLAAPIIQAPMAGTSTAELAAAVSNAGALGSIGLAAVDAAGARQMIQAIRARTERPFNVNVFCHQGARRDAAAEAAWIAFLKPYFDEFGAEPPTALKEIYVSFNDDPAMFEMLLAERPPVVSFHFGLPAADRLAAFRDAGILLLATATNLDEARAIEAAGVHMIVAQGVEAGGHRGVFDTGAHDTALPMASLVRLLVKKTTLPVIAAGGIMDGAGIRAALDLGAAAAQLGTAFVLCPESAADAGYRANLKGPLAFDTRLTAAISGRRARGLANRFVLAGEAPGAPAIPSYPLPYDIGKALIAAAKARGCADFGAQWAGQGAPLARELPAAELVATLIREM